MRFSVPFLLAIAVFTATVLGANQTSFNPNEDMLFDIVSASDAIAFRLERALGIAENPALIIGALLLAIPALLTFHLFRVGFGGAVQSIVQEDRIARSQGQDRGQAPAAPPVSRPGASEILTRSRSGDNARNTGTKPETVRPGVNEDIAARGDEGKRRGLGANIAAALGGRGADRSTSGTTSLSASAAGGETSGATSLKDRWDNLLDNKPDLSRLKSGAQGLRERIRGNTGSAPSLSDIGKDSKG